MGAKAERRPFATYPIPHTRMIPPSVRGTWQLVKEGRTIAEISAQRGFSPSTIANHIAQLVSYGEVDDVSPWVDDLTIARIRKAAGELPIGAIGPLKETLGEGVAYEQLHIARAYLNRESR